jgi:hypothetical protein
LNGWCHIRTSCFKYTGKHDIKQNIKSPRDIDSKRSHLEGKNVDSIGRDQRQIAAIRKYDKEIPYDL